MKTRKRAFDEERLPALVRKLIAGVRQEDQLIDQLCAAMLAGDHETAKATAQQLSVIRNVVPSTSTRNCRTNPN